MPLARHSLPQRKSPIPQHMGDVCPRHETGRVERYAVFFPVNEPRHTIRLAAAFVRTGLVQNLHARPTT